MASVILIEDSKFISQVAYEPELSTMTVTIGSHEYVYSNVSRSTFYRFVNAESVGKYYDRNIKGKYPRLMKNEIKVRRRVSGKVLIGA